MLKKSPYYVFRVNGQRAFIEDAWVEAVIANPEYRDVQDNGWHRFWGPVPEMDGRMLRVITSEDEQTLENAFFDRGFSRRRNI